MASVENGSVAHEYRFKVSADNVRSFDDPKNENLHIHHLYVPVRTFLHGRLPDDVNPRSHEKLTGRVPEAIDKSLKESPSWFHLLNRGLLVIAQKAWFDNKSHLFHIVISSPDEGGLADGATTDRVLSKAKNAASIADFENLTENELETFPYLRDAYVHVEVISGDLGDMLVALTGARNTSNQVKEFALENLGGKFDWLKDTLEKSEVRGRIRYRENDPQPVDVRTVLALLSLFHPKWTADNKEPVVAYTSKGSILDYYKSPEWIDGYKVLAPVAVDILTLYDYLHVHFPDQYRKYKAGLGTGSGLGRRSEVRHLDNDKRPFTLPLTQKTTRYVIPDGWLYPLLASFRMLLDFPKSSKGEAKWAVNPRQVFNEFGHEFVADVVEQSESLGRNPQSTGKSRPLWNNLRQKMELCRMKNYQG